MLKRWFSNTQEPNWSIIGGFLSLERQIMALKTIFWAKLKYQTRFLIKKNPIDTVRWFSDPGDPNLGSERVNSNLKDDFLSLNSNIWIRKAIFRAETILRHWKPKFELRKQFSDTRKLNLDLEDKFGFRNPFSDPHIPPIHFHPCQWQ